ncbi:hypothetical protein [Streptomyces sp. NPDC056165]|uniref:hypothetical protein n=1 Tax=Streptomyces sp. NPDC056165 TaxID=3345733 RepID=UPI0035D8C70C
MICDRCDKPIEGKVEELNQDGQSGPGQTAYVHPGWCRRAPRQTAPSGRGR